MGKFWVTLLAMPLAMPYSLHPHMGWMISCCPRQDRLRFLTFAFFLGLFQDLLTNHLPFGFQAMIWMIAMIGVQGLRKVLFLGEKIEVGVLTACFAFFVEVCEVFYFQTKDNNFFSLITSKELRFLPLYEGILAQILFQVFPSVWKRVIPKRRRLRSG